MATSTNGIATASDINSKCKGCFFSGKFDLTQCPTKYVIENSSKGILVNGSYESNQLVKYEDIVINQSQGIIVSIFNDKNSSASLSSIDIQYSTSSSEDGTWTSMGSKSISSVSSNSTVTHTITCSLPPTFGTTVLWFRVVCGRTGANQDWSYKTNLDSDYTTIGRMRTGYTPAFKICPTTSSDQSLLGTYGGTSVITQVVFRIQ